MRIKDDVLEGECQTNVAGAGFHAAAVDFLDDLMKKADYAADVDDPTGYYYDRDFDTLRNEFMYPWLGNTLNSVLENMQVGTAFALCWDAGDYQPKAEDCCVLAPLGKYSYEQLCDLVATKDIRGLAGEFFIWNSREKDARFFRNSALALLWHDCYFMPSRRSEEDRKINSHILGLLREAARLDDDLPFPKREYLELCRLTGKKPMDVSGLANYAGSSPMGYRRGTILERVGSFRVPVPGRFLKGYDEENYAVEFYNKKEYGYRTSYQFKPFQIREDEDFADLYSGPDVKEVFRFNTNDTKVKAAIFHDTEAIAGDYNILAQVISGTEMLLCSYTYDDPDEQASILDSIEAITPEPV